MSRLQVREPLGPLVRRGPTILPELEHYPGGRFGPYLSGVGGVLLGMYGPGLLLWEGASALAEVSLLLPVMVGLLLPPFLIPWWRRGRMDRAPVWNGTGEAPGGAVRVRGVVRVRDPAFPIPGSRHPVVYAHTRFPQAGVNGGATDKGQEDIRGVAFDVVLATGTAIRVDPPLVRLLGGDEELPELGTSVRWALGAPWGGEGRLRRSTLEPGDRVEAVGELVRDVDVDGVAAPGRGVPMVYAIRPAWKGGVWFRHLGGG